MTIVGEAELDVRAVGNQFNADMTRVTRPALNRTGQEMERTAGRGRVAFGAMWGAFGAQSQGALGPVSSVVSQIQMAVESITRNSSLAAKGMATGAVGLGVGVGLQSLGSGELAAQGQLRLSIENLGGTYDDYSSKINKTIKTGEHYGQTAENTMRVLNQLTIATKSPAKALDDYQIVLNMAAVRHVPLTTAARMLSMVYAGNSRALKTFGINLTDGTKAVAKATEADKKHTDAQKQLAKARQNLTDLEARLSGGRKGHAATAAQLASAEARVAVAQAAIQRVDWKNGPQSPQAAAATARLQAAEAALAALRGESSSKTSLTVAQEIELRKAHEAVATAETNLTSTAQGVTKAHQDAAGAVTSADQAVKLLAQRVSGQADPAAQTFSGHLHAFWAETEDDLARFGNKWGGTVTAISTGLLGTSALVEGGSAIWRKFAGNAGSATSAIEGDLANMQASGGVSLGRLAGAVAGVALAIGTVEVGKATAGAGAAGGAATTLMGAVSGAVIGLSVGGPLGAAIGGAIGGLAGLATHFYEAGKDADKFTKQVQALADELTTALGLDKGLAGAQTKQVFSSFLQKNPTFAHELAQYGVSENDLISYAQSGKESPGLTKAFGAANSGQFGGTKGRNDFLNSLSALLQAYGTASTSSADITAITGNGGRGGYNTQYPGMPPGWHPPMAVPPGYTGPGSAVGGSSTASQLASMNQTLLIIAHNTQKGAHHAADTAHAIIRAGTGKPVLSPEMMWSQ